MECRGVFIVKRMVCVWLSLILLAAMIPASAMATPAINSIKLDKVTEYLVVDGSAGSGTLTITATTVGGEGVEWSISNDRIASITADTTGKVATLNATGAGTVRVVAKLINGNRTDSCVVHIKTSPQQLDITQRITQGVVYAKAGSGGLLGARLRPSIAAKDITWTSSDEGIVTVKSSGSFRAQAKGRATITATSKFNSAATDKIDIVVVDRPLNSLALGIQSGGVLTPVTSLNLIEGETRAVLPIFKPANCDADLQTVTYSLRNPSSAVLKVDPDTGEITALGEGLEQVIATAGMKRVARVNVRVKPAPTGVVMHYPSVVIAQSKRFQLAANMEPKGAAKQLEWTSSNPDLLQVDQTGKIYAVGLGIGHQKEIVTVTATAVGTNGAIKGETQVTVVYVPVTSLVVKPDTAKITMGETVDLEFEIMPLSAQHPVVTVKSDNPKVASVQGADGSGVLKVTAVNGKGVITVMGVASGVTAIRTTTEDGGIQDIARISVVNPIPTPAPTATPVPPAP